MHDFSRQCILDTLLISLVFYSKLKLIVTKWGTLKKNYLPYSEQTRTYAQLGKQAILWKVTPTQLVRYLTVDLPQEKLAQQEISMTTHTGEAVGSYDDTDRANFETQVRSY